MTLYLRIETCFFFFVFFVSRRSPFAVRPAPEKETTPPERRTRRPRFSFVHQRTRRGMNNTLSLSDAAETLVGFGGTFLLIRSISSNWPRRGGRRETRATLRRVCGFRFPSRFAFFCVFVFRATPGTRFSRRRSAPLMRNALADFSEERSGADNPSFVTHTLKRPAAREETRASRGFFVFLGRARSRAARASLNGATHADAPRISCRALPFRSSTAQTVRRP